MPNLKNWIEAQLKRGYKAEQIKQLLASKGYPQTAVAQVDRVRYRASSTKTAPSDKIHKKFPSKPIALISIIVGIMLMVWLFNTLPFLSEQTSEDIAVEQESVEQIGEEEKLEINEEELKRLQELEAIEQMRQEEAEASMGEKDIEKLLELEAREKNKEKFEEFNNDFCSSLIPENIRNIQVKEYALNYHIDGSQGENVKWIASEQPLAEFSLFEGPQVFFVSDSELEGCGYNQEIGSEKTSVTISSLDFLDCGNEQIYISKTNQKLYSQFDIDIIKSEDSIQHIMIFTQLDFTDENQILRSLGCV